MVRMRSPVRTRMEAPLKKRDFEVPFFIAGVDLGVDFIEKLHHQLHFLPNWLNFGADFIEKLHQNLPPSLNIRFPETVQVAIFVCRNRSFAVCKSKCCFRRFFRL